MSNLVLIHGSWQASWCWHRVLPLLAKAGHTAVTPDLPGHGADAGRAADVSMQDYVEAIGSLLRTINEPPILVVHSWGGLLCAAAEAWPERIRALVFIGAAIPPNGASMMAVIGEYDPEVTASFVFADDRRTASLTPRGARQFLFARSAAADVDDAIPRLTAEPVAPFEAPVATTERFERLPRCYIETLQDRLVPLRLQRAIQRRVGFRRVFSLEADHAPYFSAPGELVECLATIASELS